MCAVCFFNVLWVFSYVLFLGKVMDVVEVFCGNSSVCVCVFVLFFLTGFL